MSDMEKKDVKRSAVKAAAKRETPAGGRTMIFVKPLRGLLIRDPATKRHVPEDGALVERSSYWIRRQNAGEISVHEGRE